MSRGQIPGGRITPVSAGGAPLAYTPAITWPGNTISGATGQYVKEPGKLTLWVSFQETAGVANATLTIPLPAGYTAVTQAGSLASGVGSIANGVGSGTALTIAAAATSITSPGTITGAVFTWTGMFVVPTTT